LGHGLFSSASDRQHSINEMLFGISFGHVDHAAAVNDLVVGRIPVSGESRYTTDPAHNAIAK
jgi:hypothetical protein